MSTATRIAGSSQRARWSTYMTSLAPNSWWRLGEASGAFADSGSGGISGTGVSGFTYNVAGGLFADTNGAVDLDGTTGRITFGDNYDFPTNSVFTVAALINPDTLLNTSRIISKETGGVGWRLTLGSTSNLTMARLDGTGTDSGVKSGLVAGVWNFVVGTYDATNVTAYVNGVAGTPVASSRSLPGNAVNLTAGSNPGATATTFLDGKIDECSIWTRVLTSGEIKALATIARSL